MKVQPVRTEPIDRSSTAKNGPRILQLELLCGVRLETMRAFYEGLLGLRVVELTDERLKIEAGQTVLVFNNMAGNGVQPFYHFALNIPENKILAAYRWLKARTPLIPAPKHLRDFQYPEEVLHYAHWNAHAVFFFDPMGNVVEFIARHDLKNSSSGDFGSQDILYVSEIAFASDDVTATAALLREVVGAEFYGGASEQFAAIGDEFGLLLVMKRGRVVSFEASERKAVDVFPTRVVVQGQGKQKYVFAALPYEVTVETET